MKQQITIEDLQQLSDYQAYRYEQQVLRSKRRLYSIAMDGVGYAIPLATVGQLIDLIECCDLGFSWAIRHDDGEWHVESMSERNDIHDEGREELCDVLWARYKQLLVQE